VRNVQYSAEVGGGKGRTGELEGRKREKKRQEAEGNGEGVSDGG
jgi:hypothetical protein